MKFSDKTLVKLFVFLIGFMNIGLTTGLALLLDDQATVKSQLLEFVIIILIVVLINYIVLSVVSEDYLGKD